MSWLKCIEKNLICIRRLDLEQEQFTVSHGENDLTVCCFAANHRVVMFLIELQLLFQCDSHVK